MTDICFIGPVSILEAHLYENNTFEFSNSAEQIVSSNSTITTRGQYSETYGFDVVCTYDEALQLKGVVEMGEMIWMNTSDLTDNDYLQHKGWVLLTNLTMELENPTQLVSCSIEYIKISDHEAEYLTMDYSKGIYDGVSLTPEYSITTTSYLLQEDGSDITTNWSTVREFPTTATTSATTDGSEFDIACASAIDGNWANAYIICDTIKFTPPFTFETVLDRNTLPGAGSFPSGFGVMFTTNDIPNGSNEIIDKRNGDYLELQWNVANTATSLQLSYLGSGGSYQSRFSGLNMGTTYAELGIRMEFTADKRVIVSTDLDTTGTWTQVYYGPTGLVNSDNLILYLYNRNKDTTSYTGSFQYENIYTVKPGNIS